MSRNEIYPWSLMTEVGDYFIVPEEFKPFKPFKYMRALVHQHNYKSKELIFSASEIEQGTIVVLVSIKNQVPPHDYITAEGIMCSISRTQTRAQAQDPTIGQRGVGPKLTVSQVVRRMSPEVRNANLPWWYTDKGELVFNPAVGKDPELTAWRERRFSPDKDAPYPAHYYLDENCLFDIRLKQMAELVDEDDEYFEEFTPGEPDNADDA